MRSNAKRKRRAERVEEIYNGLRAAGSDFIAVMGDFNDNPAHGPLNPLIDDTDLEDISAIGEIHSLIAFEDDGFSGTFGNCKATNKIDYILLSPALMQKATGGDIFRNGACGPASARRNATSMTTSPSRSIRPRITPPSGPTSTSSGAARRPRHKAPA